MLLPFTLLNKKRSVILLFSLLLLLAGCGKESIVINRVNERQANEIVVLLISRGISAKKIAAAAGGPGGGESAAPMFNISVSEEKLPEAMMILNQAGLPRLHGTTLLELFAKGGLMTSEKEEKIRYQAGIAEELSNTIQKIDGVLDADVQLSFPPEETGIPGLKQEKKITASIYIKHQGVLDDPNSHLVTKIKLLVAGSISGLDINDVTVISDRARYIDASLITNGEMIGENPEQYVSIWSIIMSKDSASRFRTLFFFLSLFLLLFLAATGWMAWKLYPVLTKSGGLKNFFSTRPFPIEKEEPPKS